VYIGDSMMRALANARCLAVLLCTACAFEETMNGFTPGPFFQDDCIPLQGDMVAEGCNGTQLVYVYGTVYGLSDSSTARQPLANAFLDFWHSDREGVDATTRQRAAVTRRR
jgi:protocatechuate 3,4-dioxygenase beta subunit